MTQVVKNDVNQIFANDAPDQDKPSSFNNYTQGWNESRSNNGKPTIKQMNFLQQRNDNNVLWIHQNGGALPYDGSIDYNDGVIVLKEGKLQQLKSGVWSAYGSSDADITTWSGKTQDKENKAFVTTVSNVDDLDTTPAFDGRIVYVENKGHYKYNGTRRVLTADNALQERGTQSLYDTVTTGVLDNLVTSATSTPSKPLNNNKIVIPNGVFNADQWFYNRDIGSNTAVYTDFQLQGNSDITTEIKSTTTGRQIWFDYAKRANISDMHLNNMDLGIGTDDNKKEGQIHARYSTDSHFNNMRFTGGDLMTFCLSGGSNNFANNLKVDFQYRYPVGYSKSPLLIGDYAEHTILTNSYVRAIHPDNSKLLYDGDLADNDQANDSKWAFTNLLGIPYKTALNFAACMWQEGEENPSNAHFFGMNYLGHGVGHGISQLSMGTDIGCTVRDSQMRGIWNANKYIGIGNHYLNILSPNLGDSNPNIGAAIHIDNAATTVSMGNYYDGNKNDVSDYTGATTISAETAFHSLGDRLSSNLRLEVGSVTKHFGLTASTLAKNAMFQSFCDAHISLVNVHKVGSLGYIGANTKGNRSDVVSSTFIADGVTTALLVKRWSQNVYFKQCKISDYTSGIVALADTGVAGTTIFTDCLFANVTFLDSDLVNAVFINCQFSNCTNSPELKGLNFKCDSHDLPSSIATVKQMSAGEVYTFPQWSHSLAGMYDVSISGGNGDEQAFYKCTIGKKFRGYDGTKYNEVAFDTNAITVTYTGNSQIKVTVRDAGTYRLKLG